MILKIFGFLRSHINNHDFWFLRLDYEKWHKLKYCDDSSPNDFAVKQYWDRFLCISWFQNMKTFWRKFSFVVEDEHQSKIYYHYALAVAGILLGIWNVIAKNMLNSGVSPITFSFIRHSGAWILYRSWHYLQRKPPNKDFQTNAGTFIL